MIELTISFHQFAFNFLCHIGAVSTIPLSIQDSSVSSMLVTQAKKRAVISSEHYSRKHGSSINPI